MSPEKCDDERKLVVLLLSGPGPHEICRHKKKGESRRRLFISYFHNVLENGSCLAATNSADNDSKGAL